MTTTRNGATPLEDRANVYSLEQLQHKRRELMKEYAPLAAKYKGSRGQGSLADSARKRHRSLIMQKILIEMETAWNTRPANPNIVRGPFKPPAETALERMANAHIEHIEYCNAIEKEVQRYILLENDLDDINEQIRSREVELYAYNSELRLAQ